MKLPSFQFYPGDWRKDPNLARCSKSAKGVWMDVICLMFECEDRGVLSTGGKPWSDEDIAMAVGGAVAENVSCLHELIEKGVAQRNSSGCVYSRRIVRDEMTRKDHAKRQERYRKSSDARSDKEVTGLSQPSSSSSSPSKTTTKTVAPPDDGSATPAVQGEAASRKLMKRPTVEEVAAYLLERKSPVEAEAFVSFYESNGWRVGKNPMRSWHAAVVTWERRNQPDRRLGEVKRHWSEIPQVSKTN